MQDQRPSWQRVFDETAPILSTPGLKALARALETDDPRLLQGCTTTPPPLRCVQDWPVEGACALSYCGWQGDDLATVAEVEEFFARMCFEIDQRLGEPAGCRWFLNWFDETPRDEMRPLLLAEVNRHLAQRESMRPVGAPLTNGQVKTSPLSAMHVVAELGNAVVPDKKRR